MEQRTVLTMGIMAAVTFASRYTCKCFPYICQYSADDDHQITADGVLDGSCYTFTGKAKDTHE